MVTVLPLVEERVKLKACHNTASLSQVQALTVTGVRCHRLPQLTTSAPNDRARLSG